MPINSKDDKLTHDQTSQCANAQDDLFNEDRPEVARTSAINNLFQQRNEAALADLALLREIAPEDSLIAPLVRVLKHAAEDDAMVQRFIDGEPVTHANIAAAVLRLQRDIIPDLVRINDDRDAAYLRSRWARLARHAERLLFDSMWPTATAGWLWAQAENWDRARRWLREVPWMDVQDVAAAKLTADLQADDIGDAWLAFCEYAWSSPLLALDWLLLPGVVAQKTWVVNNPPSLAGVTFTARNQDAAQKAFGSAAEFDAWASEPGIGFEFFPAWAALQRPGLARIFTRSADAGERDDASPAKQAMASMSRLLINEAGDGDIDVRNRALLKLACQALLFAYQEKRAMLGPR